MPLAMISAGTGACAQVHLPRMWHSTVNTPGVLSSFSLMRLSAKPHAQRVFSGSWWRSTRGSPPARRCASASRHA